MDLNLVEEKEEYHPFPSTSPYSTSPLSVRYNPGFISLSNDHDNSQMGGSAKNLKFTDLSMGLECHEEENGHEEGDDYKRNERELVVFEKEHMFDKVVTPSDVGKLNRLVIPKQHAERFFPLDSSTSDKGGLLLSFEDRTGKPWRFRYSYWNSSQSYVMTKGWSRFVKEKKLDAGDIVSFQRGVGDAAKDRLFIDWRHKPKTRPDIMSFNYPNYTFSLPHGFSFDRPAQTGMWNTNYPSNYFLRNHHHTGLAEINDVYNNPSRNTIYGNVRNSAYGDDSVFYLRSIAGRQHGIESPVVLESVPVVQGTIGPTKRQHLRLFGVDMDCVMSSDSDEHENVRNSSSTSQSTTQYPQLGVYSGTPVPSEWFDKGEGST